MSRGHFLLSKTCALLRSYNNVHPTCVVLYIVVYGSSGTFEIKHSSEYLSLREGEANTPANRANIMEGEAFTMKLTPDSRPADSLFSYGSRKQLLISGSNINQIVVLHYQCHFLLQSVCMFAFLGIVPGHNDFKPVKDKNHHCRRLV